MKTLSTHKEVSMTKNSKYSLTPEHEAQFPAWTEKWINNAFQCGTYSESDKERARTAMRGLYRAADLEPPTLEIFCPGPVSAAIAGSIASAVWYLRENPQTHVELFGRSLNEDFISNAVSIALQASVMAIHGQTYTWPDNATNDATRNATEGANDPTTIRLAKFLVRCTNNWNALYNGGNHWSGSAAYLSFFRHIAKLDLDYTKWQHYETLAEFGPRFLHKNFWIISEYPEFIHKDAANRPHAEKGPYCRWRDGVELYYHHGVQVPKEWILSPQSISAETALRWPNTEQRRAAVEIVGWKTVLKQVDARTIDADTDPMIGNLLEVDLPDSPNSRFLSVTCGTGRQFCIPVPKEKLHCKPTPGHIR